MDSRTEHGSYSYTVKHARQGDKDGPRESLGFSEMPQYPYTNYSLPTDQGAQQWQYMSPPQGVHTAEVHNEASLHSPYSPPYQPQPYESSMYPSHRPSVQDAPYSPSFLDPYANLYQPSTFNANDAVPNTFVQRPYLPNNLDGDPSYPTHHSLASGQTNFLAEPARKVISTDAVLRAAERRRFNPRKFFCPYCSRGFTAKHNYDRHIAAHNGSRPYFCNCGSTFTTKSDLKRHQDRSRRHTQEYASSSSVHPDALAHRANFSRYHRCCDVNQSNSVNLNPAAP